MTAARRLLHRSVRLTSDIVAGAHLMPVVRWWNRTRPGIILVYHEISAEVLSNQLDALSRTHAFVSLDELVTRVREGRSTRGVAAITFDDGLAPVVEASAQIAEARGWPMTWYLPTAAVDGEEIAWYQELGCLIDRATVDKVHVESHALRFGDPAGRAEAFRIINQSFLEATSVERVAELRRAVRLALTGQPEPVADLGAVPTVGWPRVAELARSRVLSFEAHSVNHLPLGRLPEGEVIREMEVSRERIEEATGVPVRHFCYPFGSDREVGVLPPELARTRFRSAVTTARGRCGPSDDPARLPRIPMLEHEDGDLAVVKAALALALAR
jgi:peptidoglycan/xylan/chitin deacetylase (PgdA/CDA1 family)